MPAPDKPLAWHLPGQVDHEGFYKIYMDLGFSAIPHLRCPAHFSHDLAVSCHVGSSNKNGNYTFPSSTSHI
jgi:hypothetical protein